MFSVTVFAAGSIRKSPFAAAQDDYLKRLGGQCGVHEYNGENPRAVKKMTDALRVDRPLFVCDSRGGDLTSEALAERIEKTIGHYGPSLQFVIGGADGVSQDLLQRPHMAIAFGRATWPHLLARVMLLEQLYRARQILAGHPYHRE